MLLLFSEIGKGCIRDKNRKVLVNEVAQSSYKGNFIIEELFYFFDNLRAFHEVFSGKMLFVNYVIPVLI